MEKRREEDSCHLEEGMMEEEAGIEI